MIACIMILNSGISAHFELSGVILFGLFSFEYFLHFLSFLFILEIISLLGDKLVILPIGFFLLLVYIVFAVELIIELASKF